ncbi:hypothetical protein, conserved [Eimeria tenella]|uniref:Uncharacterized protein n=1 Tax=Eimeria tenella TaxID=5802 RepID=U6KXZ6_EIMTE|nr:hypothetical protein, conserved [Eimeria tenella]CDJ42841.1 hypothetical protein, conserved [Eimeria tenella]|eukprot:XP_013233591.1 hypothetical protein, conserved [Eimeria tenella]
MRNLYEPNSAPAPERCKPLSTEFAALTVNECPDCAPPPVVVEGKVPCQSRHKQLEYRSRVYLMDQCPPADGSSFLEAPSAVPGRSPSHSSSRTRSLSVSPPVERHPHRAGRRLRALGGAGHGARARSLSPEPVGRVHYRASTTQEGHHHTARNHTARGQDLGTYSKPRRSGRTRE